MPDGSARRHSCHNQGSSTGPRINSTPLACNAANDHVEIGSFPVQAVDTTGAGDLFAGGALFGLTRKLPLKQCGILGSYCAGQVVSYMGARLPKSAVLTVNEILNRYPGP